VATARRCASANLEATSDARILHIYHAIRPLSALSPLPFDDQSRQAQQENESDWCQALVNGVLPLLLPPEDLSNPCLDVLVSEIFSNLILRNTVLGRVAEPWLLWEGVTKAIRSLTAGTAMPLETPASLPQSKLEQFGLLANADTMTQGSTHTTRTGQSRTVVAAFWSALDYAALLWTLLRALVIALMHASTLPSRPGVTGQRQQDFVATNVDAALSDTHPSMDPKPPAFIQMSVWNCLGRLLMVQQRMPWLAGFLSLTQWLSLNAFGGLASTNSAIDR
jgi:hypothetical protein